MNDLGDQEEVEFVSSVIDNDASTDKEPTQNSEPKSEVSQVCSETI